MSPAAGGAAPTQPAASDAVAPAAIAAQESGRPAQPPSQENPRDPAAVQEGADPSNAAARKTAWSMPPPSSAAAGPGGIIGGEESWPALADSTRGWPKSASSDSLSLSDGSAPSAPEDLIAPLLPVSTNPISPGANPTFTLPPSNASSVTSSRQSGGANRPNLVGHGGGNVSSEVDGSGGNVNNGSRSSSKDSSSDDNISSRGDGSRNNGVLGGVRGRNSSYGDNNSRNSGGDANDNDRRTSINGNSRGGGSNSFTGSGEGSSRNGGAGGSHWSNNARNGNGSNNGFGSRSGRNRRDHERGGSFSARNYPRFSPVPHQQQQQQQQQLGMYQPGSFHRPLPPPPPGHFMVPPAFMPYVSPFAYPADAQAYPFYMTIDQQFQDMHLVQQPMHPLWVHQDQEGLQEDIRKQIEFYFSTNNLCHDIYLRKHMNEQGWVPIDLLVKFPMLLKYIIMGLNNNYILDAIRGSEILEVQGNNVRRRNDWANWLLHQGFTPTN